MAEVLAEAEHRFRTDPVHHALVETAARVLWENHHALTGTGLDEADMDLATHAASVALVLNGRAAIMPWNR